jgi:hypothetical protein
MIVCSCNAITESEVREPRVRAPRPLKRHMPASVAKRSAAAAWIMRRKSSPRRGNRPSLRLVSCAPLTLLRLTISRKFFADFCHFSLFC